jgi:hypothetical protein
MVVDGQITKNQFLTKSTTEGLRVTILSTIELEGIFIFGGGNKRLRNVTKMYCQCQISHKRRKKEYLGKFKFSLN